MPDVQCPFFFLPLHWPAHWVLLHIYVHNLSLFDWQGNLAFGTDPQAEGYRTALQMDTSPDSMILCLLASAEAKGRTKALQKLGKKKKKMPPAPPS